VKVDIEDPRSIAALFQQVKDVDAVVSCAGGSVTVTSGVLARQPMPGGAAISMVNAGLEGFVRGAAAEAPRGVRVNAVSPPWVTETLIHDV
jgi:NAD(P)-dependent dehydrogenase (short-subunit alcohol dehydrogenase family)